MLIIGVSALIIVILLAAAIIRRLRGPQTDPLGFEVVTTMMDSAFLIYRRWFFSLLAFAVLCAPLGIVSGFQMLLALQVCYPLALGNVYAATPFEAMLLVGLLMSTLGIGKTLLTWGVAQAAAAGDEQGLRLEALLPRRWPGLLAMALVMMAPALASTFLGILGLIVFLPWQMAPAVMATEQCGAVAAVRRSYRLLRNRRSLLSNIVTNLWGIGWLMASVPLYGAWLLIGMVADITPDRAGLLALSLWAAGSIVVAPLVTLGVVEFYRLLYRRGQPPPAPAPLGW